jgi:hypothetical protein
VAYQVIVFTRHTDLTDTHESRIVEIISQGHDRVLRAPPGVKANSKQ